MYSVFVHTIQVLKISFTVLGFTISFWEIIMYSVVASLVASIVFRVLK